MINFKISDEKVSLLKKFVEIFEQYNSHTNLMSKNDLPKVLTKHIPDSLSIEKFFEKYGKPKSIIDIGTGGGFPSIPLSIVYNDIKITAVDSISKKIKFINVAKECLKLENLNPVCERIEKLYPKLKNSFDVVTSRALADLSKIIEYSTPFLKKGGYIVAYKAKNADIELENAKQIIKKSNVKFIEKIKYPLEENEERYLMVFQKTE